MRADAGRLVCIDHPEYPLYPAANVEKIFRGDPSPNLPEYGLWPLLIDRSIFLFLRARRKTLVTGSLNKRPSKKSGNCPVRMDIANLARGFLSNLLLYLILHCSGRSLFGARKEARPPELDTMRQWEGHGIIDQILYGRARTYYDSNLVPNTFVLSQ
jgi:hypothetical protein